MVKIHDISDKGRRPSKRLKYEIGGLPHRQRHGGRHGARRGGQVSGLRRRSGVCESDSDRRLLVCRCVDKELTLKRYKDFMPETEESYITQEMLAHAACSPPTLIKWIKEWEIDGKPIGFKRGGRWVVNIPRLNKFLRGHGKKKESKTAKPRLKRGRRDKPECVHYPECLESASMADLAYVCPSGCPDYRKGK